MSRLLRISETASLAMHAMALLVNSGAPLTTARAAARLRSSANTLAKVFQRLVKSGLVKSRRGKSGGFVLRRSAAEITLLQIYEAIEGPIGKPECLLGLDQCIAARCAMRDFLHAMHAQTLAYLGRLTVYDLANLIDGGRRRRCAKGD